MADDTLPSDYDAIVLGTGMTECILAAALSRVGLQVLHLDRNDYYSGDWATFHFQALQKWISKKQGRGEEEPLKQSATDPQTLLKEKEKIVPLLVECNSISNVKETVYVKEDIPVEDENTESQTEEKTDQNTERKKSGDASTQTPGEAVVLEHKLRKEKKEWTFNEMKKEWRKFNLDLTPRILFSKGSMVELLISSDIAKYCEFKTITRVLTHLKGKLEKVPCSRADVFASKQVNMIEKRMLMKFLTFCLEYEDYPDVYEEYEGKTFLEFLKSQSMTPNVQHYILQAIAMATQHTPLRQGLENTKRFIQSIGRYGNTAFLWPLYGCGELPQCFCRMCAVFGGIYCLRRTAVAMVTDADNKCQAIIDTEGARLNTKWLVMASSYASSEILPINMENKFISRAIFITDRSILQSDQEEITLLCLPPGDGQDSPIFICELSSASMACPKDLYVVHMVGQGLHNPEKDFRGALSLLFQPPEEGVKREEDDKRPSILWSLFYTQQDTSDTDLNVRTPENAFIVAGPNLELDFEASIQEARKIFSVICPGEEFLPKAPNPEDIIFDDGDQPGTGGFASEQSKEESAEKEDESKDEKCEQQQEEKSTIPSQTEEGQNK